MWIKYWIWNLAQKLNHLKYSDNLSNCSKVKFCPGGLHAFFMYGDEDNKDILKYTNFCQ